MESLKQNQGNFFKTNTQKKLKLFSDTLILSVPVEVLVLRNMFFEFESFPGLDAFVLKACLYGD
jgi:hypothetical protein